MEPENNPFSQEVLMHEIVRKMSWNTKLIVCFAILYVIGICWVLNWHPFHSKSIFMLIYLEFLNHPSSSLNISKCNGWKLKILFSVKNSLRKSNEALRIYFLLANRISPSSQNHSTLQVNTSEATNIIIQPYIQ